jgi:hypothetical protein
VASEMAPEPLAPARELVARRRPWLVVAGAIVAIALVTVLAIVAFTGREGARGGAPRRPALPAELEDALQRLEESVRP